MNPASPKGRHRRHANPLTLGPDRQPPPATTLFARPAPLALDIGCGAGAFVLQLAAAQPQWNVLGLEIRPHLVAQIQADAARLKLANASAVLANANVHLPALVPSRQVVHVSINFPDPWYKRRHHKRRVVTPELLEMLCARCVPGARLHLMTDYAPVAEQMRSLLLRCGELRCLHPETPFVAQSTTHIRSEREIKHAARGEVIYRLLFAYQPGHMCPRMPGEGRAPAPAETADPASVSTEFIKV